MSENDLPTLAWLSSDPAGVGGFNIVTRELMKRLPGWNKAVIALCDDKREPMRTQSYTTYHVPVMGSARYYLDKLNPELIVCYGAFWHLGTYFHSLKDMLHKTLMYIVIDCPFNSQRVIDILPRYRRLMVPSQYNVDLLNEIGLNADIVPHGVDTNLFTPKTTEPDTFTIGCVAENQIRKQLPRLMKALEYLKDLDIKCKLITKPLTPDGKGFPLNDQVKNYGLENIVEFLNESVLNIPIPSSEMPDVYSDFTIQAMPTAGEAFCIPLIEAAATGVPTVITDTPGPREVLGDSALYVKSEGKLYLHWGDLDLVDPKDMADKIRLLYEDRKLLHELSQKSILRSKQFSWNRAAERLYAVLEEELQALYG
jgi:glycosyltransferase involved in cell wall biosynthesis